MINEGLRRWVNFYKGDRKQWPVIPLWGIKDGGSCACPDNGTCHRPGKHPRIDINKLDPDHPVVMDELWEDDDNVGLLLGRMSGVVAIHIPNDATMASSLPHTFTIITGTGDRILLYTLPAQQYNISGSARTHIEEIGGTVLGEGEWVVLPPSLHASGVRYRLGSPEDLMRPARWIEEDLLSKLEKRGLVSWDEGSPFYRDVDSMYLLKTIDTGGPMRSLTPLGCARRLVDKSLGYIRFTPGLGWYYFDYRWHPDERQIHERAQKTPEYLIAEADRLALRSTGHSEEFAEEVKKARDAVLKCAEKSRSYSYSSLIFMAEKDARVHTPVDAWNNESTDHILPTANGRLIVDLHKYDESQRSPQDWLITQTTPVPWRKGLWKGLDSGSEWATCLNFWTDGDQELAEWLQVWAGYCLSGSTEQQAMLLLVGPGGTGKSTFVTALGTALGSEGDGKELSGATGFAGSLPQELIASGTGVPRAQNPELLRSTLVGKRMVVAPELSANASFIDAEIKGIVGGDVLQARRMRQNPFEFRSQAKLIMTTNHLPNMHGDPAIWRRMKIVRFDNTLTTKGGGALSDAADLSLFTRARDPRGPLVAEVLDWAVAGAKKYFDAGAFPACAKVSNWKDEIQASDDLIGAFLKSIGSGRYVATSFWGSYSAWRMNEGLKSLPLVRVKREFSTRREVKVSGDVVTVTLDL